MVCWLKALMPSYADSLPEEQCHQVQSIIHCLAFLVSMCSQTHLPKLIVGETILLVKFCPQWLV